MNHHLSRATTVVLTAADITFAYPTRHVFTQWSHSFGPGLTWLKGRNGDGKSTLLRILAGSLVPRSGRLSILGADAQQDPLEYRRKLFWCGPGQIPFDHLTPTEYFGFMAHLYPGFSTEKLQKHVDAFGLEEFLGSVLNNLSTGTQRKVWICAALSADTAVTLLDEPFNALDAKSARHLQQVLVGCAEDMGRTWVVVSHEDLGLAGERAAVIDLSPNHNPQAAMESASN